MVRIIRLIITLPLLLLLILFALSNQTAVRLTLWPTDYSIELPLSLAMLTAAAIAFLLGALVVWVTLLGQRRRARHAEATVRLLETQLRDMTSRLNRAPINPPEALPPPSR